MTVESVTVSRAAQERVMRDKESPVDSTSVLHDRAFRITHGRGVDVDPIALIKELDFALTRLQGVVRAADLLNDLACKAVFEDGHEDRLLIENWPLVDALAQYREARQPLIAQGELKGSAPRCEKVFDGHRCTGAAGHPGKLHAPSLFTEAQECGERSDNAQ